MSLDFVLIPFCIIAILWLFNRENKIYRNNKKPDKNELKLKKF